MRFPLLLILAVLGLFALGACCSECEEALAAPAATTEANACCGGDCGVPEGYCCCESHCGGQCDEDLPIWKGGESS